MTDATWRMAQQNPCMVPGARVRFVDGSWPPERRFIVAKIVNGVLILSTGDAALTFAVGPERVKPVVGVRTGRRRLDPGIPWDAVPGDVVLRGKRMYVLSENLGHLTYSKHAGRKYLRLGRRSHD